MDRPRVAAEKSSDMPVIVTPEIAAEAAVWVARLHGPNRSAQMERELLDWQARSAAHREAFERCTETWESVPLVSVASAFAASEGAAGSASAPRRVVSRWTLALAAVGALVIGAFFLRHGPGLGDYRTDVGEQRQLLLDDGTRLSLNTDTRVHVEMRPGQRTVDVVNGEALFEVANDPHRPFVVRVGGSEVVAVGTVFAVQLTSDGSKAFDSLAVTLLEGKVTLRSLRAEGRKGLAPERPLLMQPGERVRLVGPQISGDGAAPTVDRPSIEQVVAWRRSEAVFDGASLADAVAEMNRYSRTKISLVDESMLVGLQVSGVYRTGDNAAFAQAIATLHGLSVREQPGRLELLKPQ